MPIFKRYKIDRYKEVMINQPSGLVIDGDVSSYILDDSSDFLGIIKSITLLGEVTEVTMDTGFITVGQINNTTQADFDQQVLNGVIRVTEEILGWVEIGKTRASFYYQDCLTNRAPGKETVSEHYYDFSTFGFGNVLVAGSSPADVSSQFSVGEQALRPVGTFDPNIENNMGVFGPRFNSVDLQTYMRNAVYGSQRGEAFIQNTTGETRPIVSYSLLDGEILRNVLLYSANREEHFDNQNAQVISPGKYGRNRSIIEEGFRSNDYGFIEFRNFGNANFFKSTGQCLSLTPITPPPVVDEESDEDPYIDWDIADSGGGPNEDGTFDYETEDDVIITSEVYSSEPFCADSLILPVRDPVSGIIVTSSQYSGIPGNQANGADTKNYYESLGPNNEDDQYVYYLKGKDRNLEAGIIDPRENLNELSEIRRGFLKYVKNISTCTLDVYANFRDKDGDIPELVGPIVSKYMENIRGATLSTFNVAESPLLFTGYGSDGLAYYSDGNSYLELHGESLLGCGKKFTFADIPEIFTEMYSTVERPNVETYRYVIERSTQYSSLVKDIVSTFGAPAVNSVINLNRKQLISDVVDDITLGIPDMDFAEIGTNQTFLDTIATLIGAAGLGVIAWWKSANQTATERRIADVLKATIAGYIGTGTLLELLKSEEDLYKIEPDSNRKPEESFYKYKFYDAFWSRPVLSSVYLPNNGVSVVEQVDGNGNLRVVQDKILIKSQVPSGLDTTWEGSEISIEDLKRRQSLYALPSRWKSMMRPIYEEIWYDQEAIKPQNVSTTPYLGQNSTKLELGDYDTHRINFGMRKNLYDEIDDTISTKIDQDTLRDIALRQSNIGFFNSVMDNSNDLLRAFLDPFAQTVTQQFNTLQLEQLFMSVTQLIHLTSGGADYSKAKTYIEAVNAALKIYGISTNLYRLTDFATNPPDTEELKTTFTQIGNELLRRMFDSAVNFIINLGLDYLERSLDVTNTSRSTLSPRRVMKPASTFLRSRSGFYSTNKQPCPIIFLGFNDDAVMSTFSDLSLNGTACLSKLTKKDDISTVSVTTDKFNIQYDMESRTNSGTLVPDPGNIGRVPFRADASGRMVNPSGPNPVDPTQFDPTRIMESRTNTIPVINKRIRQYGRNPFLDLFYLNLIPDSSYATSIDSDSSQFSKTTHLSPTPSPFRYPSLNNMKFSKVMNSNIPSIFPPWWNEPAVVEGYNNANISYTGDNEQGFWKETERWNHADIHFQKRKRNNILRAKDRWSMTIEDLYNDRVAVLTDKTPILDIYFGLLNLHVWGVDWAEILPLITEAKRAVKLRYNGTDIDEDSSSIDLDILEDVWRKIQLMLDIDNSLSVSGNTTWVVDSLDNKKPEQLTKKIRIHNNSTSNIRIVWENVKITPDAKTDRFNQTSNNVFYFGNMSGLYPGFSIEKNTNLITPVPSWYDDSTIPWDVTMERWNAKTVRIYDIKGNANSTVIPPRRSYELEIHFVPYRIQPNFWYSANLEIPYTIENPDGTVAEESYTTKELSAQYNENGFSISERDRQIQDIQLPSLINFGIISDINAYESEYSYLTIDYPSFPFFDVQLAHHIEEDVFIKDFIIENEYVVDYETGDDLTDTTFTTGEINLFKFSNDEKLEEYYDILKYDKNTRGTFKNTAVKVSVNQDFIRNSIGNVLPSRRLFGAELVVKYQLSPRLNTEFAVEKEERCRLYFVTSQ